MEYEKFTSPKKQTCSCTNLFLTRYYNGKEVKDLHFCYTTHITIISQPRQAIWVADLLVQVTVEKWRQDH